MAKISLLQGSVIKGLSNDIDFYFEKGKPVARFWPRHPKQLHTPRQRRSQDAFSKARKAWSRLPDFLKSLWYDFFYGKRQSAMDFYTTWFIRFYMSQNKFPPVVDRFEVMFEDDFVILSFHSSICEPMRLFVFDNEFINTIKPKFTHGLWDLCYSPDIGKPIDCIVSEPCWYISDVEIPFISHRGIEKIHRYGPFETSLGFFDCFKDYLNSLKNCIIQKSNIFDTAYISWQFTFREQKPYPNFCGGGSYSHGDYFLLDKSFIEEKKIFQKFDFIICQIDDCLVYERYDAKTGQIVETKPFSSWRIDGHLTHKVAGKIQRVIKKTDLENHGYIVAVYPDFMSRSPRLFLKRFGYVNDDIHRAYTRFLFEDCVHFYGANPEPYIRFKIPKMYFTKDYFVTFSAAVGRYFLLPPMNLGRLVDLVYTFNPEIPSKRKKNFIFISTATAMSDVFASDEGVDDVFV